LASLGFQWGFLLALVHLHFLVAECPQIPFALDLTFLSFRLAHPDNAFFARRSSPTPETVCPNPSPAVGMLEVLAACSGVSVLLTPKRVVSDFNFDRFQTTGSSLSLAEISTAGSLVAAGPLNGAPELPAPC
jgi:hypothetical protein